MIHIDGAALRRRVVRGGGEGQGRIRRVPLGEAGVIGGGKRRDSTGRMASTGRRDSTGKRVAGAAVLKMELLGGEGGDSNKNRSLSFLCRRSQAWQ